MHTYRGRCELAPRDGVLSPWRVLLGLAVVIAALLLFLDTRESQQETAVARGETNATAARATSFADQILDACVDGSIPNRFCDNAQEIRDEPVIGPRGEPGVAGQQGIQGIPGLAGIAGIAGPAGQMGVQGIPGIPGVAGPVGPAGSTGATGATGGPGSAGATGATGAAGQPGAEGPAGPMGPAGPVGPQGGCQAGEVREEYVYPDGRVGSRCVEPGDEAPPEEEPDLPLIP